VNPALLLLLALQGPPPAVTAEVDHARLAAGEELLLTIRARTQSAEPLRVVLPALTGFAIVGSHEVTAVTLAGLDGPVRLTTRELELRAGRPGALAIGPVRVRQGGHEVATAPILVTVDSAATTLTTALSPIARGLLEGARPPGRNDRVELTLIIPGDSALVGQQLDVIAAAWFPRELRARLRRPPILTLQTPEGVWAYPGAAPSDVAASRLVRGRWMDLFAAHQAVFPLAPGRLVIPPAAVEYAVPVTFSFFSREDRYSLRSDSVPVAVLPLPAAASAAGDAHVVAHGLGLEIAVDPPAGRVGEPIDVTARVSGVGNVALWPEPAIGWPAGLRAYPGATGMRIDAPDGRIAGVKTFHYLVVADSAGAFLLAAARYPYYDISAGAYAVATSAARGIAVAPGLEPRPARALPPLLGDRDPAWADALARALAPWGWLVLLVGPPLLAWLWRRRAATPALLGESAVAAPVAPVAPVAAGAPAGTRLGRLEREFYAVLASHVPDGAARDGDGLARALRAAGSESAVADHIMRLRDRLRAARYGPRGRGDAADLAAELEKVLRVLGAEGPGRRRRIGATLGLVVFALVARPGEAQAPSAEALYEAGALRAAADSFAARATAEPRVPAHWYNLGATLYRAGADGKASAAWAVALRLAPRDRVIRHARELLPTPDAASEALVATGPATPQEWALVTAGLWIVLWGAVAVGTRRSAVAVLVLLLAVSGGLLGAAWQRRARPLAIVLAPGTPVRVAPYGSASASTSVAAGAALLVERARGPWLEVRRSDGIEGWLLASEVVRP
jgi:hypothetical protein